MGEFHDDAQDVDEATARKVFGRCILAGELGREVEGEIVDAVRLVREVPTSSHSSGLAYQAVQEHRIGVLSRWKADADAGLGPMPPYAPDIFHPGVPCNPGAWGSETSCAMHAGYDLDENGLCVEGRRAVKLLELVIVPPNVQRAFKLPALMTREEVEQMHEACSALLDRIKKHDSR